MSVSINDKGGAEHRINLVKRGIGVFQSNMLKTVLVKKAENYHLQCDRFLTNDLPPISQTEKLLISIKPKGGPKVPEKYTRTMHAFDDLYNQNKTKFMKMIEFGES